MVYRASLLKPRGCTAVCIKGSLYKSKSCMWTDPAKHSSDKPPPPPMHADWIKIATMCKIMIPCIIATKNSTHMIRIHNSSHI